MIYNVVQDWTYWNNCYYTGYNKNERCCEYYNAFLAHIYKENVCCRYDMHAIVHLHEQISCVFARILHF